MSSRTIVVKPKPSSLLEWGALVLALVGGIYILGESVAIIARHSLIGGKLIFIFQTFIAICLFATPVLRQLRSPHGADIFAPPIVVFAFLSIPYMLRPLQMILKNDYSLIYPRYSLSEITILAYGNQALLYANAGLALFLIGYYSKWGDRLAASLPNPNNDWDKKSVRLTVLLFSLLSVFTVVLVIHQTTGSVVKFIQNWDNRVSMLSGYHLLVFLARSAALGSITLLLYHRKINIIVIPHLIGATLLVLVFGRRAFALTLLLMFLVAYHYSVRRIRIYEILPLGIGIFSLASIVRHIRQSDTSSVRGHVFQLASELPRLLIDDLGRGFDNFVILLQGMPGEWTHQYGTTYLRVPLNFVPRAIWSGKPALTVGSEFATRFFPGRPGGVPLDIFALQYLNFHLFGIVIGLFIIGIAYRTMYAYLQQNSSNRGVILLYAITIITFRSGITNNNLVTWIITVGIALAMLLMLGNYKPRRLISKAIN